jgi:hypothetical protein
LSETAESKVCTVRVAVTAVPAFDAVIVTVWLDVWLEVVAVKVAVVAAAATVTFAGTDAAALLLDRVTTEPPAGAAALRVTVPVEFANPPTTVAGLTETDRSSGLTVRVAVLFVPAYVPVMVAAWFEVTTDVVAVNVAVVAPTKTVTLAGTAAAVLLLPRVTTMPPAGAAAESVAVPVEFARPPTTLVGLTVTELRV